MPYLGCRCYNQIPSAHGLDVQTAVDVLDYHYRIIDDSADSDSNARQRHDIKREAQCVNHDHRGQNRDRYRKYCDQCSSNVTQEYKSDNYSK
ncbi:hypothetical protein D3C73_1489370 [compost metagenome]